MLIQLELQNFIFKEIFFESKQQQNQAQTQADFQQFSLNVTDINGPFNQVCKNHSILKHSNITHSQQIFSKNIKKLNSICLDTFASDKIVRLLSSFLKILKNFKILKNTKKIDKCYIELIQLRRLLRINRILAYFKQFLPLLKRTQKNWLDYFNIIFKNLLLVLDINDLIGYLQQLNLIGKNTINSFDIKKRTANLYFFQCLMWLFLNVHDFFKNKNKRTHSQNLRKQLTILKYFLDSFTSYNDFSRRYYTLDTKINTFIGTFSSIVGLYTLWV